MCCYKWDIHLISSHLMSMAKNRESNNCQRSTNIISGILTQQWTRLWSPDLILDKNNNHLVSSARLQRPGSLLDESSDSCFSRWHLTVPLIQIFDIQVKQVNCVCARLADISSPSNSSRYWAALPFCKNPAPCQISLFLTKYRNIFFSHQILKNSLW